MIQIHVPFSRAVGTAIFIGVIVLLHDCTHYVSRPIVPTLTAAKLESRTLSDPGLRTFIAANAPTLAQVWPRPSWDLNGLTLVAFYYHPSLDIVRAQVSAAQARLITARARPNPSIGVGTSYAVGSLAGTSPWLLGLNFDIPLTTANKRGLRIAGAQQLAEAAKLQIAEAGWSLRSKLRAALVEYLLTVREGTLLQTEIEARVELVHRMKQRLAIGEVSRTEVDNTEVQLVQARITLRAAEGRAQESRIALATALGLPLSALEDVSFEWPGFDELPNVQSLSTATVQTEGLLNRLDVRRALLDYAAQENALQLEVAKQYPDVHLQPGYSFDQGEHKFAFGLSIELPIFNRNQGPIAEARARREQVAAQFQALQAQVIGELHKARAQYAAALAELHEIDTSLTELQDRTEKLTQRAFDVGEADRLALASVKLQHWVVAHARLDTLRRAQIALGALEDAVQSPLAPSAALPEIQKENFRETTESR